ncbi:MAG TPA: glutathione transferase GstA [Myxococcales bacterium]|nr:glutathione transferase GstA [Myxococcales bacterium]
MKLYYMPGACSLAPHIALREAGMTFDLVRFDAQKHALESGAALESVNEKGYVPVLELDGGERLTEVSAVLQYVADQAPATGLAPANGTFPRYRLQEWLNYLATEIHKSFWPFFHQGCEAEKPLQAERLHQRLSWVEKQLDGRAFLTGSGETFTVADCYLLTVVNWIRPAGFDLAKWPGLQQYRSRLRERPSVKAALEAEGLLKRG